MASFSNLLSEKWAKCLVSVNLLTLIVFAISYAQLPAFPGAEGFGCFTTGGRGGKVLEVTNLNDSGPGSFRAAIEAIGARTIVFRVSGTIQLQSELRIQNGDLTIAGQTAPGDGSCIRNFPLIVAADNVIIRFLRSRLGDVNKIESDAFSVTFQKNIIADHCSFSWGIDETASFRDNINSIMQWCIISESLNHSFHHKGDHGYGGIWGGMGATFHHNLLAHHASRNPRFNGSRYHGKPDLEIVDFRNNVIYNWGLNSAYGGEGGQHNIIANYYKSGPASKHKNRILEPWDSKGKWFVADNFMFGFPDITTDNHAGGIQGQYSRDGMVDKPFAVASVITHSPEVACQLVLATAGAVFPKRDVADQRIIRDVMSGTASFGGVWSKGSGIIDSQEQVGGWPELRSLDAPADNDHDGMPDTWEIQQGLDAGNAADTHDDDNDGYTNLEEYLNSLAVTEKLLIPTEVEK